MSLIPIKLKLRSADPTSAADPTEISGPTLVPKAKTDLLDRRGMGKRVTARQSLVRGTLVFLTTYMVIRIHQTASHSLEQALIVTAVWLPLVRWAGAASRTMPFAVGAFVCSAGASFGGFLAMSALGYWFPGQALRQGTLIGVAATTFLIIGTWDYIVRRITVPKSVLIVGGSQLTEQLLDDIEAETGVHVTVLSVIDDAVPPGIVGRVPHSGPLDGLARTVQDLSPDLVVVAVTHNRPEVFRNLLDVAEAGFQVVGLPELYELLFGRLPIRALTPAWFMSVLHFYNRPYGQITKRTFDVVVAMFALLIVAPLVPLIVVTVKRTRGPLLYRQTRLGEHGQLFTMLKFRSMRVDAEALGEAVWAEVKDPRVILGGQLLRRLRLDELPQLVNVLRGEMSIVGPRPERPEFVEELEHQIPYWTRRNLLRPGITGWAQIRAGYAADTLAAETKLSYDLWYLRHRSLLLDLLICLRTLPGLTTGRGAR